MRRAIFWRTLLVAALPAGLLAGCSSGSAGAPVTYVTAQNAADITVSAQALRQAEQGSESFGLALLRQLGDEANGGDMAFSPQTLVDLLAMILPGAQGQTASQLADALGAAGLDSATTAGALGKIDATARADGNQNSNTLQESSDVWTAKDLKLAQGYLATLAGAYGVGVHQTDFAGDPEGAREAVNNLVSQETHGFIQQLFPSRAIDAKTRIVLTDAVYLNASWAEKFDPKQTSVDDFYAAGGKTTQASMMNQSSGYRYASGAGWQLVEIPYAGGKLAMDVLLPAKGSGTLDKLRDGLTAASLNSMINSMTKQQVELSIPKFTVNYSPADLKQTLTDLGLGILFTDPDLGAMTAAHEQLVVSKVVEKAYVAVGENGTVAAAAAGGSVSAAAASAQTPVVFDADHPFLYLIRDISTGQLLFAGQQTSGS